MTHGLATVFVNNQRVEDFDEPTLTVRDLVRAYGRDPQRSIVYRLDSLDDPEGEPLALDDVLDLAQESAPLLLRCETKRTEAMAPSPFSERDMRPTRPPGRPDAPRRDALGSGIRTSRRMAQQKNRA